MFKQLVGKKANKFFLLLLMLLFSISIFAKPLLAYEFVISGNGEGSTNEINISQSSETTVVQSNTAEISNTVNAEAATGGNTADSNTGGHTGIVTGDAEVKVVIQNTVNSSQALIAKKADDKIVPTPTPTPKPPGKEVVPPKKVDEEKEGKIIPVAVAAQDPTPEPEVLAAVDEITIKGLADVSSSQNDLETLFFWLGLLVLTFGAKFAAEELARKNLSLAARYQ